MLSVTSDRGENPGDCAERSASPSNLCRESGLPVMKFLKNINWGNVATIAVVSLAVGLFIVNRVRPAATKIPVVGKLVS